MYIVHQTRIFNQNIYSTYSVMTVIPESARRLRREFIGEVFAGHHFGMGHAGHAIHVPGLGQAMEVDGVGEIMGVVEGDLHPVALLHPQGGKLVSLLQSRGAFISIKMVRAPPRAVRACHKTRALAHHVGRDKDFWWCTLPI